MGGGSDPPFQLGGVWDPRIFFLPGVARVKFFPHILVLQGEKVRSNTIWGRYFLCEGRGGPIPPPTLGLSAALARR